MSWFVYIDKLRILSLILSWIIKEIMTQQSYLPNYSPHSMKICNRIKILNWHIICILGNLVQRPLIKLLHCENFFIYKASLIISIWITPLRRKLCAQSLLFYIVPLRIFLPEHINYIVYFGYCGFSRLVLQGIQWILFQKLWLIIPTTV